MMVRFSFAVLAFAGLVLALSGSRSLADDKGDAAKKADRLEKLAAKLKLDDKQKEALREVHTTFDAKADPIEHQLWALQHEEHEAMHKILTASQRSQLPAAIKPLADQEFEKATAPLKLTDEQKTKIGKIREEYEPKFKELFTSKEKGEKTHKEFRELRHHLVGAIRAELTEEQRDKLPLVLREEHRFWHNRESRREVFKAVGEKIGVTAEQKEQFRKLDTEYEAKIQPLQAELKKFRQEEHAALEKVLTDEQRTKWKELHKGRLSPKESDDKK